MKTISPSRITKSLFGQDSGEQTVRLIKAAQAGQFLNGDRHAQADSAAAHHRKNPEIRLVGTGADYCDLEVICGCGEGTRIRCWNAPSAEEKGTK